MPEIRAAYTIEHTKKMAGNTLDPEARAFVPVGSGSRNSRTDSYYDDDRNPEPHWGSYGREYDYNPWDDRYYSDHRHNPRDMYLQHEPEPTHSSFPSSQELRDFYKELQSDGTDYRKIQKSRVSPPRQQQQTQRPSPPPQERTAQRSPGPSHIQAGCPLPRSARHPSSVPRVADLPSDRNSPPRRRESTPPQTQRRSSPPTQMQHHRPSPKTFAKVTRSSRERTSAHNTPSPTIENRTQIEESGRLNAPDTSERQSTSSVERRTKNSPPKIDISYDADAETNLIRSQLEFYFSDKNLLEESSSNLIFYMLQGKMWVPLHVVIALPKIRDLKCKKEDVLNALRTSSLLELNAAENKVRRPGYKLPPDFKVRKSLRRSVLVYGLPQQMTDAGVRSLLETHGNILCVAFPSHSDGPDIEMGRIIMKKKLGDPKDLQKLTCAFVVFESQSQANKCVKARSRSSSDGIRTMHKYDYNKVAKRLGKGMSPNSSPLWTPTASPSFNSEPRSSSLSGATPTLNAVPGGLKLSPAHGGSHGSPHFGSRSMSRSPVVRSMNSRSPFYRSQRSPGPRSQRSPSWKLGEGGGELSSLRQRSSSMQNRRVIVAKGPDNSKGFRWPRNPQWKSTRTTLDVLNTTMV